MTDPETLTPAERSTYIRQLQRTVAFWQTRYAQTQGRTREELVNILRHRMQHGCVEPIQFRQDYEAEFLNP